MLPIGLLNLALKKPIVAKEVEFLILMVLAFGTKNRRKYQWHTSHFRCLDEYEVDGCDYNFFSKNYA